MPYYERIITLVDPTTGEVLSQESGYISTPQQESDADRTARLRRERQKMRRRNLDCSERYGLFVWLRYDSGRLLCPELQPSDLPKLLFIGSMKGDHRRNFDPTELGRGRTVGYAVIRRLLLAGYIDRGRTPDDISDKLVRTGAVDRDEVGRDGQAGCYRGRLFKRSYQAAYHSLAGKNHTIFGHLLRIIPFLNRKYNIFCAAPFERYLGNIQPLTCKDIADVLGITLQYFYKNKHILLGLKVPVGNTQQLLLKEIVLTGRNKAFILNPCFFYAGSDWCEVEELGRFEADAVAVVKAESTSPLPVGPGGEE